MSVIAWDGKTLAADRACTIANTIQETRKSRRLRDGSIAEYPFFENLCKSGA